MSTQPTDALELLREIYADLVQGAIPNADDPWWQKASAALAGTPTHAQAGAVPLTDEQIDRAIAELGLNYLADAHATNRAMLRKLCHHANGIKGGQHVE